MDVPSEYSDAMEFLRLSIAQSLSNSIKRTAQGSAEKDLEGRKSSPGIRSPTNIKEPAQPFQQVKSIVPDSDMQLTPNNRMSH